MILLLALGSSERILRLSMIHGQCLLNNAIEEKPDMERKQE